MSTGNFPPEMDPLGSGVTMEGFTPGQIMGEGRYVLKKILGQGGMGIVWLAHDTRLDEEVALKFLPPQVRLDPAALDDLRRETAKSRKLTHPNIVRIHDLYESKSADAFISMEYVEGLTLSHLRVARPGRVLPWTELDPLVRQLCAALDYAHGEKVIHRDLKPGNLMLDSRRRLKLADFGIARVLSDSMSRNSLPQATSGSPPYMSPQQMDGRTARPTDDLYALGATLYELLTSKPPFYSGDVVYQARNLPPEPMALRLAEFGLENDIPPQVESVVMQCLAKEPHQRPQSAGEVLDLLTRKTTPPPAPIPKVEIPTPPPGPPPPKKSSGSGALRWIGVTFLVLVLLGLGVVALLIALGQQVHSVFTTISSQLAQAPEAQASASPTPTPVVTPPPPAPVVTPPAPVPAVAPTLASTTTSAEDIVPTESDAIIDLYTNGTIKLEGATVTLAQLQQKLKSMAQVYSGQKAILCLQDNVEKEKVNDILDTCQPLGVQIIITTQAAVRFNDAMALFNKGQYADAAKAFSDFARDFPNDRRREEAVSREARANEKEADSDRPIVSSIAQAAVPSAIPSPPVAGQPWTNSLGVKFVPAGTDGILFGVWDVRVKDYQAFVTATGHDWPKPSFTQTENDPAVNVSWDDAHAFCDWLTRKEQAEGILGPNQKYRLPTDAEWSTAVGLNESTEGTPKDKDSKIAGVYPWGTQWPPPTGAGNYDESLTHDGCANTSPVGSFTANAYGLYDMGGNVCQWCEDKYDKEHESRVLRGASSSSLVPQFLLSSFRNSVAPGLRGDDLGFRVVVVVSP